MKMESCVRCIASRMERHTTLLSASIYCQASSLFPSVSPPPQSWAYPTTPSLLYAAALFALCRSGLGGDNPDAGYSCWVERPVTVCVGSTSAETGGKRDGPCSSCSRCEK